MHTFSLELDEHFCNVWSPSSEFMGVMAYLRVYWFEVKINGSFIEFGLFFFQNRNRFAHPYWALIIHMFLFVCVEYEHISCGEECVSGLQLLQRLPSAFWPPTSGLLKQRWDWTLRHSPKVTRLRFVGVPTFWTLNNHTYLKWQIYTSMRHLHHILKVCLMHKKYTESSLEERLTFT